MELISAAGQFAIETGGRAHWAEQLRVPDLSVGTYSIPAGATDDQSPHTEDEIYVITAGRATFVSGADAVAVGPGSVIYVPAREAHRFTDITEDLAALVLFAPAEESRAVTSPEAAAELAAADLAEAEHAHDEVRWDQEFWDDRYQSSTALWSGEPNPQLVAEAGDLTPGTALDVGAGEGADALWLAGRGWQVTALDVSQVALARAAQRAADAGPDIAGRIRWAHADILSWVPEERYDLVSAQFLHLPPEQRAGVFGWLAEAVAPGGSLLIVGHHPSDLESGIERPHRPELFFTGADIEALLEPGDWDIVASTARERSVTGQAGQPVSVQDAVLRAQRRR